MVADPSCTQADRSLQAALAEQGLNATPAQFKRWRHCRILDSPERPGAGRGNGRPSHRYPEAAVAQASAIMELLKLRVPLNEMALAMFVRGAPTGIEPIRQALHVILAACGESWLAHEADEDRADALVEHVLRRARRIPLVRHWTSRAHPLSKHPTAEVSDMVTAVVYAATIGSQPSPDAVATTAAVFGLDEAETTAVFARTQQLSPHALSQLTETVTLTELADGKRHMEELFGDGPDDGQKPDFRVAGVIILGLAAVARMEQKPPLLVTGIDI